MRSLVAAAGLFVIALPVACGYNPHPKNGALPCTSHCPDGYVCGAGNYCWLENTPDNGGTSAGGSGGFGGVGGSVDAGVPDAPGAQPDVSLGGSVGGAGGIIGGRGTGGSAIASTGGAISPAGGAIVSSGGTTGSIGGTIGTRGGTTTGGAGGIIGGRGPGGSSAISTGGAISRAGGTIVSSGGTTGSIGGTISTGGGTTTGGAGGVGGGLASTDAGVAGAGGRGAGGGLASADANNCGVSTVNLTKQPADLLLVLDKTGSMTSAMDSSVTCAAGTTTCQQRWTTVVSGLDAVLSGASGDVNWGLELFNSDGNCGVAAPEVPIAPESAATIQTTIAGVTPGGNTPTKVAVNTAVAYLRTLTDTNGKYILLATDGEPNCLTTTGGGGVGAGASDVAGTVAAITAAAAAGFKVYVVGVGPETGNLDNFAAAGGTGHYYPALSPQDLNAALATIVGTLASCTFNLGKAPPEPNNVAVEFNHDSSLRAPHDTTQTNGWDYTDSTNLAIQLFGSWCDNVANGTYTSVAVLMGCTSILSQ
jgi:hypothetical protein